MNTLLNWLSSQVPLEQEDWLDKRFLVKSIEVLAATTIGGPRSRYKDNQDVISLASSSDLLRCVVVDGAGSTNSGRRAAIICGEIAQDLSHSLGDVYRRADERIRMETRQGDAFDPKTSGYGAVVGVDIDFSRRITKLVWWGDCRALLLRGDRLEAIGTTLPQNVLFERVTKGEVSLGDYYRAEGPAYLTGGLGFSDLPDIQPPTERTFSFQKEDVLLLGSDGVWDQVSDYEIEELWRRLDNDHAKFFEALKKFVYLRNNAMEPFTMQLNQQASVQYRPDAADNTSLVMITNQTSF